MAAAVEDLGPVFIPAFSEASDMLGEVTQNETYLATQLNGRHMVELKS